MRYEMTKDLETGNALIDSEHRQLFKAVNDLLDACSQGKGRKPGGVHPGFPCVLCGQAFWG